MLNSLKKWVRNDENVQQGKNPPSGLQTMRSDLQKKFAKGVQYNLKIIIRGDRNTGKTCLWHRLQGHKFIEEYVPTAEIQATSIQWNYKATDDIVKVDVWDVVDQGKRKASGDNLKVFHEESESQDPQTLDASFLDVYKGAHAVLMLFDITKKWTYQYIERELPKVPAHIPVLILANHRDMGQHRVITLNEVQYFVENIDRPPGSASIFFLESSMKNGFGLKYIHKFFNLPFLLVQRESLLKQLETNHLDVESCLEELHYEPSSEEQNFDYFVQLLHERNNPKKASKAAGDPTKVINGKSEVPASASRNIEQDVAKPKVASVAPPSSLPVSTSSNDPSSTEKPQPKDGLFSPSMMTDATSPTEQRKSNEPEKRGFMSRFFRGSSTKQETNKNTTPDPTTSTEPAKEVSSNDPVKNIDDFVPDDADADSFLNEIPDTKPGKRADDDDESSSDDEGNNPMVAGFQEELDSDDQFHSESHKAYSYSDSDNDYAISPRQKATKSPKRVSSRSFPKSRVSPEPKKEDEKLQSFAIESDDSSIENVPPEIMIARESISDDNYSPLEEISIPATFENFDASSSIDTTRDTTAVASNKETRHKAKSIEVPSTKVYFDDNAKDSSSEDESVNHMVSGVVEDVSFDEEEPAKSHKPPVTDSDDNDKNDETREQSLVLQLQSTDLDFLEQISTAPVVAASGDNKSSGRDKSSKSEPRKSKSGRKKHKEIAEETGKKHKHKKKKSKSKELINENGEKVKKKKKSSRPKDTVDNDLEEFLGGKDYESF